MEEMAVTYLLLMGMVAVYLCAAEGVNQLFYRRLSRSGMLQ
jgi:hypothetical protein